MDDAKVVSPPYRGCMRETCNAVDKTFQACWPVLAGSKRSRSPVGKKTLAVHTRKYRFEINKSLTITHQSVRDKYSELRSAMGSPVAVSLSRLSMGPQKGALDPYPKVLKSKN